MTKTSALPHKVPVGTEKIRGADTGGTLNVYHTTDEIAQLRLAFPNLYGNARYYPCAPIFIRAGGPNTFGSSVIYYHPFILPAPATIHELFLEVNAAGGATAAALAVYDSQLNGSNVFFPTGNPLGKSSANLVVSSNGMKTNIVAADFTLKAAHVYFAAMAINGSCSMAVNAVQRSLSIIGSSAPDFNDNGAYYEAAGISVGTWPDKTASPSDGSLTQGASNYFVMGFKTA